MKFRVTLKDPDEFSDAIDVAAQTVLEEMVAAGEITMANVADAEEIVYDKVRATTNKYLTFNEQVTLEFDTEAGTCIVVPKGD